MKTSIHSEARGENPTDTKKLVSLLALATGAVALPQTGQADIIYTSHNSNPKLIGWANDASFTFTLPGSAQMGFARASTSTTFPLTVSFRTVVAGGAGAKVRRDANFFVVPLSAGATWSQGAVGSALDAAVGIVNDLDQKSPATGYDNKYLAWSFVDDSLNGGGATRYGWVEVSLALNIYNFGGPQVTVWGYAYDDSGVKPTMGQMPIPEPTSGALLVMGAMALGARGLRKWRQNRQPANQA